MRDLSVETLRPPTLAVTPAPDLREAMSLGATMYVPILHPAIHKIVAGVKYPNLKSVVLCLEDALRATDVQEGLRLLAVLLDELDGPPSARRPWLFLRPRNLGMARIICGLRGIDLVNGLVIPKLRIEQVQDWWQLAECTGLRLMPTLECVWVLDPGALQEFAAMLEEQPRQRIVALRVGGNDLLGMMQLRRMRGDTIYDGPLTWCLAQLMCQLGARGYPLTAPVFDVLDDAATLARECARDAAFGFVGKTAVHPAQIDIIQRCFAVGHDEVALARQTLSPSANAVFQAAGMMLEPATHHGWAKRILTRAEVYGIKGDAVGGGPAT